MYEKFNGGLQTQMRTAYMIYEIIMKGKNFLSNLTPFIEKVGIFEIISIEGISK